LFFEGWDYTEECVNLAEGVAAEVEANEESLGAVLAHQDGFEHVDIRLARLSSAVTPATVYPLDFFTCRGNQTSRNRVRRSTDYRVPQVSLVLRDLGAGTSNAHL
jgi:hypothetical protein